MLLKSFRKLYFYTFPIRDVSKFNVIDDPNIVQRNIEKELLSSAPCMIARFGSTELACLTNYIGIINNDKNVVNYIVGKSKGWWWEVNILNQMQKNTGFFPPTVEKIEKYCNLFLEDISELNLLGSWLKDEQIIKNQLNGIVKFELKFLDPFWSDEPWTKVLKGKKILVIHPFKDSILSQYEIRDKLFSKKDLLPDFKSLTVIKSVQSLDDQNCIFQDWFEALDFMKSEIDRADFDICLIGCGAYGFHLAAHVKRIGKKAVHMGGSLQLLFGIMGKRWDDAGLYNEFWKRPYSSEHPNSYLKVEDGCYW